MSSLQSCLDHNYLTANEKCPINRKSHDVVITKVWASVPHATHRHNEVRSLGRNTFRIRHNQSCVPHHLQDGNLIFRRTTLQAIGKLHFFNVCQYFEHSDECYQSDWPQKQDLCHQLTEQIYFTQNDCESD